MFEQERFVNCTNVRNSMGKDYKKLIFSTIVLILLQCILATMANADPGNQQPPIITGKISDASTGEPIPGANIIIVGTNKGTVTDLDGNYAIVTESDHASIQVSSIGYLSETVPINGRRIIDVSLILDITELEAIVVVGYGTQQRRDLTGAISRVDSDAITKSGGNNVATALQGRVSGVEILNQGQPGGAPRIRIRGLSTNSDPEPLYVVDGMFVSDIGHIASRDIESIEILKDASSTAIFGSRGSNGVVLITTKKGKTGEPTVNFTMNEGFHFITNKYDVANAREYGELLNIYAANQGRDPVYTQEGLDTLREGTNWYDETLRNGKMRDYQISLSGGTENIKYNLSASYFDEEGVVKYTDYERYTLRANNQYKVSDRISFGHNLNYSKATSRGDAFALNGRGLNSMSRISPLIDVYKDDESAAEPFSAGQATEIINPYAAFYYARDLNFSTEKLFGNAWLDVEIINNLNFRSSFGVDRTNGTQNSYTPAYGVTAPHQINPNEIITDTRNLAYNWLWENTFTYSVNIQKIHRLTVLAGYTAEERNWNNLTLIADSLPFSYENMKYIQSFNNTTGIISSGLPGSSALISYIGRVNYALKDKYLLTTTFRADGSSKFPKSGRWGYFPSIGLGWRISEESFMQNLVWLNNFKIRGSWGQTGSEKISDYAYFSSLSSGDINSGFNPFFNFQMRNNATITERNDPNIKWEFSEQTNIGVDMNLFRNRLRLEFDWYTIVTENLLINLPTPGGSIGFATGVTNAGSVGNKGIEFLVSWNDKAGDFNYGISLKGSMNNNEVLDFKGQEIISEEFMTRATHISKEGGELAAFYGYEVIGVFRDEQQIEEYNQLAQQISGEANRQYQSGAKPGDLIFADIDGNGYINVDDKTIIGSPHPDFTGGLTIDLSYKGFDFSANLFGSFGNKIWNVQRIQILSTGNSNLHVEWLDSWTEENPDTGMPRLHATANYVNNGSSFNVLDGSYIKIQNVELGYTLDPKITQRVNISSLRVFVNLTNPLYITNYIGLSPEVSNYWGVLDQGNDFRTYPVSGTARLGLNLTF